MGLIKALSKRDLVTTSDLVSTPGVRHLGLGIPSIFQLIFKPNTHAVKRERAIYFSLSPFEYFFPPFFLL